MSTIKEKISLLKENEKFYSFEFFPPKTDGGFRNLLARLTRMSNLNPLFVTITWGAGGSTSEKSLELASTCQKLLNLTTVLHLTCTNTNKEIIDHALALAKKNGVRNILALRGDPPRTEEYWTPNCDFSYAVDLVKYIKQEHGDYFCVGVAGYPEGHVDGGEMLTTQSIERDLPYLVEKVEAGADFIITQLFLDSSKFLTYEKLLQDQPELAGIPLIPGLMPITTFNVFSRATKLSHASVPPAIMSQLTSAAGDDGLVKQIGVDILIDIIDKIDKGTNGRIKGYHFYCLNLEKAVASIIGGSTLLQDVINRKRKETDDGGDGAVCSSDDEDDSLHPPPKKTVPAVASRAVSNRKSDIDISSGKGILGKDAIWDDFPNGRFGDSNSPAYGEIDGYGPTLKVSSNDEARAKWGEPESTKDLTKLFVLYLLGKIDALPWVDSALSAETSFIQEELFELNQKGWFSLASQPAVDGFSSSDRIFGWGPKNGHIYQKSFVELFIPKAEWDQNLKLKLEPAFQDFTMTYYLGDSSNNFQSNLNIESSEKRGYAAKNAITWGYSHQEKFFNLL